MTAGERMTRAFDVVHPDVLLEQVPSRLASPGRRPVLVCEHDRLIGVLDPEVLGAGGRRREPGARPLRVRDAIAPDVLFCLESTDLAEAAALMREHRAPIIPVLDASRRLVGVVALADVPEEGENSPAESGGERVTGGG